jgi:lipopolysaccharide export LptBFGC system permease protein LptF
MSAGATRGRLLRSNANALLFLACVAIWSTNWIAITTQVHATPVATALF